MLSELTFAKLNLTTTTKAATAAYRVDIYPQGAGCLKYRCAYWKATASPRRSEHHQRILSHDGGDSPDDLVSPRSLCQREAVHGISESNAHNLDHAPSSHQHPLPP